MDRLRVGARLCRVVAALLGATCFGGMNAWASPDAILRTASQWTASLLAGALPPTSSSERAIAARQISSQLAAATQSFPGGVDLRPTAAVWEGAEQSRAVKFQHFYRGVPVLGSMLVHFEGLHSRVRNRVARFDASVEPRLSLLEVTNLVQNLYPTQELDREPELQLLPAQDRGSAQLVWTARIRGSGDKTPKELLISAVNGQVLAQMPLTHTELSDSGPHVRVYSAKNRGIMFTETADKTQKLKRLFLMDCEYTDLETKKSKKLGPVECARFRVQMLAQPQCQWVSSLYGSPTSFDTSKCDQQVDSYWFKKGTDPAAITAGENLKTVVDYYKTHFGRKSYDGRGTTVEAVVHAGNNWYNAHWDSMQDLMAFGDGGVDYTNSLSVIGHEFTHAVVSHSAHFFHSGESGALNEAYADIFGLLISDKEDWINGRDLYGFSSNGIRNLRNPGANGDPSHYRDAKKSSFLTLCKEENDYCAVHGNATIPGHAAFRIYEKIGKEKMEKIYYQTLTRMMTPFENFKTSALETVAVCKDLYDAETCGKVQKVFEEQGMI